MMLLDKGNSPILIAAGIAASGLMIVAALSLSSSPLNAASGTAEARVANPISITPMNGGILDFGQFAADADTPSTVTISPAGPRSTGGADLFSADEGGPAVFVVDGEDFRDFIVTLPADNEVELTGPGDPMPLTGFTSIPGNSTFLTFPVNMSVGATLNVGANQPPGNYSGLFTVEVTYDP